jgi:hypothetical protein
LKKSVKYTTRSTAQGAIYFFSEPEKVYRRRLNRLAPRRLLESLGEEAVTYIQFLFQTNNQQIINNPTNTPNVTMSIFLRPLNFVAIQGAPHDIPEKVNDKLPSFQGNNAVSVHSHILNFHQCVLKYCKGLDEMDVQMTLFVYSLEGDAAEWFTEFDSDKFSTLDEILVEFRSRRGDKKENRFQFAALTSSHKNENETVEKFNTKFDNLVKNLHADIKPSTTTILIYYMEAFEGEMRYALRDKDPQDLKTTQAMAIKIDRNMQDARESNIPGFTRGSSSQPYEEKKKSVENQKSSNAGVKELTQLIKQMEINHANQIKQMEINHANQIKQMEVNQVNQNTAIHNRLIAIERCQASRPPYRPNDKWPKKSPSPRSKTTKSI